MMNTIVSRNPLPWLAFLLLAFFMVGLNGAKNAPSGNFYSAADVEPAHTHTALVHLENFGIDYKGTLDTSVAAERAVVNATERGVVAANGGTTADRLVTHRPVADLLAEANAPINEAGISQAARAWDKHAGRSGGTFESLSGTTAQKNATVSNWINEVLTNPQTTMTQLERGGVSYRLPNGQGVVFEPGGKVNLLDPRWTK